MNPTVWIAGGVTLLGALLMVGFPLYSRYLKNKSRVIYVELGDEPVGSAKKREVAPPEDNQTLGADRVLRVFLIVVAFLGLMTLIRYWDSITNNADKLYFSAWLFIFMLAGMFVQVISSNYKLGKPLFDVTGSQLVYPVLFSVVVFYPIWAIAASGSNTFFAVHAAFLNGYFWESVVSNTGSSKKPNVGGT